MTDFNAAAKLGIPIVLPNISPSAVTWTPTGTWTTNTTYVGKYWQVGPIGHYYVKITLAGAPTSNLLSVNMPSGQTIDTSGVDVTQYANTFGRSQMKTSTTAYNGQVLSNGTTTSVTAVYQSATTGAQTAVNATSPATWVSGDIIELAWSVPVVEFALTAFNTYNAGVSTTGPSLVSNGYETGSFNATLGGATTAPTAAFTYVRIGKLVTLQLVANLSFTKDGSVGPVTLSGLPASIRPSSTVSGSLLALNYNSTANSGNTSFSNAGVMTIWRTPAVDTFAAGTNNALINSVVSYVMP